MKQETRTDVLFKWVRRIIIIALVLYLVATIARIAIGSEPTVIEIENQGQGVYLGDTVNVQKVLGWGDILAFAWFEDDYYDETPDEIYEITGDQHRVYLDPLRWKVGLYFKWSGEYQRAEYPVAFRILPGRRPEALPKPSGAATPEPTLTPEPLKEMPRETHILLARGDDLSFKYFYNMSRGVSEKGYLWLFHSKGKSLSLMGEPMPYNNSLYRYEFDPIVTEQLEPGWYNGFIQFTGKNGYQDVFYDYQLNNLDTPYDDKIIPDVNLDPFIPERMRQEFEKLATPSQYCDDILIPITVDVRNPYVLLTEYYEDEDTIITEGITSASEGTEIMFVLDPDRWALPKDKVAHTWFSTATGDINEPRRFTSSFKLKWDEMSIGMHMIQATLEKHKFKTEGTIQFRVTDIYVMPTPTPYAERVIVEEYGTHRPNSTNRTAILLQNVTTVPTTIIPTTTPTPNITTVQPVTRTPVPAPAQTPKPTPTINVPVEVTTVLVAAGIGLWRIRK